jgi:hypothetical protein
MEREHKRFAIENVIVLYGSFTTDSNTGFLEILTALTTTFGSS